MSPWKILGSWKIHSLGSVERVLGLISDVYHELRWGNTGTRYLQSCQSRLGRSFSTCPLHWAADQGLGPVLFPVSWKSVFLSLRHVLFHSLREAYSG